MLEACLGNKVIRDFLKHYKQSRWQKLIPSLIEIAILNLNSSFHTLFFSEEDINNIIQELKGSQTQNNFGHKHKLRKDRTHIIFSKPSHEWRTADGGVVSLKSHSLRKNYKRDRDFLFDNSSVSNHSTSKHSNNHHRKKIKNVKSKIREQIEMDKINYYNRRYRDDDDYNNNNYGKPFNQIKKINYAISYDKNLQPELIEKTTFNKNKKGRKKIIQKMTQEEYEQQFPQREYYNENEYYHNNNDYEENEEEEYYALQIQANVQNNNNNISNANYQNQKRNNLYHYKNDIIVNNLKESNNSSMRNAEENNKGEIMQNPQQSFNPQYYKNSNELNQERNNYINIENNSNEQPSPNIGYKYRGRISESDDKSSKLIGIEKKYQKKIDELEQNILNNNDNNDNKDNNNNIDNIDNYANKLQVNVTDMEEYMNNNMNASEEENQLSDNEMNDEGVLSQMSNMTERTKLLFKKTMDEYPPMEEDTFYDQNSLTK